MQWTDGDFMFGSAILIWLGFVVAVLTRSLAVTLVTLGLTIVLDIVWQWVVNDHQVKESALVLIGRRKPSDDPRG